MNRFPLYTRFGRRELTAAFFLAIGLATANGCAVWDWARPAANPDAAGTATTGRAQAGTGGASDPSDSGDDSGALADEPGRVARVDDNAPEMATRFRPRAARRSENLLLDERSRQIERNLGL
jgi:hypothetical protein